MEYSLSGLILPLSTISPIFTDQRSDYRSPLYSLPPFYGFSRFPCLPFPNRISFFPFPSFPPSFLSFWELYEDPLCSLSIFPLPILDSSPPSSGNSMVFFLSPLSFKTPIYRIEVFNGFDSCHPSYNTHYFSSIQFIFLLFFLSFLLYAFCP